MVPQFYNDNATKLAQQYLSKSFDQVHKSWSQFLPSIIENPNARILDLGAGAGRDVKHLAKLAIATHNTNNNIDIYAVEPAKDLALIGKKTTENLKVKWLEDALPALNVITKQEVSFDLILLSAVWMHIPPSERARSIRKLANLLKPGGKLVISLRHGQTETDFTTRKMHTVCADELKRLAIDVGLFTQLETPRQDDELGRDHIHWHTVVLQLPDDGTGAFPFIRHVAINDGKAATHKLALLRVLLRIADGHPGAVLRREPASFGDKNGDRVILPAGLVALYWCHQYKGLIDTHQLYQTPSKSPNMGFMKANGWHKLTHRSAADYRIGNLFTGDDAIALHKTISAAVSNIKNMPCRYITLPNNDSTVFEVENKTVKAKDSIFLDLETLEQWGEFSLPESTWLAFNRYACWIEPVLVSEWVKTMAGYAGNKKYSSPEHHYVLHQALNWLEPKRSTVEVRQRFEQLKQQTPDIAQCVWSAKSLTKKYDIDHSMPFARWPNNDLWNLLPADSDVNNQKSDRLPTEHKLRQSKERIQHWWREAWLNKSLKKFEVQEQPIAYTLSTQYFVSPAEIEQNADFNQSQHKRFFAEANIALPGLNSNNQSIDDLFEALVMQRSRLKEMQQLREWV